MLWLTQHTGIAQSTHAQSQAWYYRCAGQIALFAAMALVAVVLLLGGCSSGGTEVSVRAAVNEYSWDELHELSAQIASAQDGKAAEELAMRYNLLGADGKLDGTQHKDVVLADGTQMRALIVGFRHDRRSDGGNAGITFMFDTSVAQRPMNANPYAEELERREALVVSTLGGWQASDLRAWLNGGFAESLPEDLQDVLVAVDKASLVTNQDEVTEDAGVTKVDSVRALTVTSDKLWEPAFAELVDMETVDAGLLEDNPLMRLYADEGNRYQLFADADANGGADGVSALLQRGSIWWTRTLDDCQFATVLKSGVPELLDEGFMGDVPTPGMSGGVAPFFCV